MTSTNFTSCSISGCRWECLVNRPSSSSSAANSYRDILEPLALGDEMRAVFVTNAACWGTLCLHRERGAPHTRQPRRHFLHSSPHTSPKGYAKRCWCSTRRQQPHRMDRGSCPRENLSVVTMSPVTAFWLAELAAERGSSDALPHAVMAVVKRLQALECETTTGYSTPKLRVHTPSGHWR